MMFSSGLLLSLLLSLKQWIVLTLFPLLVEEVEQLNYSIFYTLANSEYWFYIGTWDSSNSKCSNPNIYCHSHQGEHTRKTATEKMNWNCISWAWLWARATLERIFKGHFGCMFMHGQINEQTNLIWFVLPYLSRLFPWQKAGTVGYFPSFVSRALGQSLFRFFCA